MDEEATAAAAAKKAEKKEKESEDSDEVIAEDDDAPVAPIMKKETTKELGWEVVNDQKAIWQRKNKDIADEEYKVGLRHSISRVLCLDFCMR